MATSVPATPTELPPNLHVCTFKHINESRNIHVDPRKLVLLTDGLDFYLVQTLAGVEVLNRVPPKFWLQISPRTNSPLYKYDRTKIQTEVTAEMTVLDEALLDNDIVWQKVPDLNNLKFKQMVDEGFRQDRVSAREIAVCERLRVNPHPNICAYQGVLVTEGRVTALCFDRYSMNLRQMVRKGLHFDADACLAAIEAGLDHLHSLNIIHVDIKPGNIFVRPSDNPIPAPTSKPCTPQYQFVIGDFDSAQTKGEKLRLKSGTPGWTYPKFVGAQREVDLFGLGLIRAWLVGKGYGVPDLEEEYEDTKVILGRSPNSDLEMD